MIQQTTLANGITVITDKMADLQTLSIGVYINTGSRREGEENNGVAHYLEHMAFKGTTTRSAEQISKEIEDVGAYVNAYTSYDVTAYYCRLMKEDMPLAVDILSDILTNSTFLEEEMNRERGAILQEISMYNDSPEDVAMDKLRELQYPNQSVGRPILGSVDNVMNMKADDLRKFMADFYHGNEMVIAAAGAVDHDELVALCTEAFSSFKEKSVEPYTTPEYHAGNVVVTKPELEQAYVAYSWKGEGSLSPNHYANLMMTSIMGQGMTSKLWTEVREKRGLAYSVYSGNSTAKDYGTFNVYAGTSKDKLEELESIIQTVVSTAEMTEEELKRSKKGAASSIAMAMESSESRMERLAHHLFTHGRVLPVEESLSKVYGVTLDDVNASRERTIQKETLSTSIVGPIG